MCDLVAPLVCRVCETWMLPCVQGMCDLVAPLLVVLDDEAVVFSCFRTLMKRMIWYVPNYLIEKISV